MLDWGTDVCPVAGGWGECLQGDGTNSFCRRACSRRLVTAGCVHGWPKAAQLLRAARSGVPKSLCSCRSGVKSATWTPDLWVGDPRAGSPICELPLSKIADLWVHPRSGRPIQDRSGVTAQGCRTDRPSWGSYPGDRTPKTGMLNRRRALSPHPKDRPAIAWVRDPTRAIRPAPLSCDPRSVGQIEGGPTGQRFYLMVIHRSGIQISDRRAIGQRRSGVQVADFTPDLQLHRDLGTPDLAALSS